MWNFKKITLIWDYGSQNICKSSSSSCRILFNFLILLHPVSGSRFSNYVSFMNEKRRRREKKLLPPAASSGRRNILVSVPVWWWHTAAFTWSQCWCSLLILMHMVIKVSVKVTTSLWLTSKHVLWFNWGIFPLTCNQK